MFLQPMPTIADRISTLPDSILCHILSYLPTKLAVATSILSKRWRPLWLSVPTLDFDDRGYTENGMIYSRFIHLVYRTMLLRDGGQPIKVFNLKCTSFFFCDPSIVDTWVTAATKRKVEHLSLLLASTISLPSSVLTSRTLVVLKLKGLIVDITPPSVDLPSLKTLHLREVQFLERRYVVEFLSACPVLEDLLMKFLKVPNSFMEIMNVGMLKPLPKLVRADISMSNIDLPFKALCNAEFLRADVGFFFKPYSFLNMTYMELIFQPHYWVVLIDLLRSCPSLQNLVIDKIEENIPYMRGGSFIDSLLDLEPQFVPCCLKAQLKKFCFRKYGGEEHELQFTSYVMQNARVLRCVTICSTGSSNFQKKLEMLKKLSVCPRNSTTCQLYFE